MIFDHRVKIGGVWYNAGVEVDTSTPRKPIETPKVEKERVVVANYKRADIQKMNEDELKEVATNLGIKFTKNTEATRLKKDILVKLGI